jgi:hypothetical protein
MAKAVKPKTTPKSKVKPSTNAKGAASRKTVDDCEPETDLPLWFDIRAFTLDRDGSPTPQVQSAYNHINFMIHLLWGVPYHSTDHDLYPGRSRATIHGPINLMVDAALANIHSDTWPTQFARAKISGVNHSLQLLDRIRSRAINGNPKNPTLIQLFTTAATGSPGNEWRPIINACIAYKEYLAQAPSQQNHNTPALDLCLPIIEAQANPPHSLVPIDDFLNHKDGLNKVTMLDLYINPLIKGDSVRNAAVMKFKDNGVFRPKPEESPPEGEKKSRAKSKREDINPEANQYGNGYKCNGSGTGCQLGDPTCFCSLDSANNCSAMTTCH